MKENNPKKVIVAMSGGVDSGVAAAILKKQGFDVRGVFFLMRDKNDALQNKSLEDAKKVAEKLEIPFVISDIRKKFRKDVMDDFICQYQKGATPNPCVVCNPKIKFHSLFQLLGKFKADWVATGHYSRIVHAKNGSYHLWKAQDETKDQSYFLYGIKKEQLEKILFPLGEMTKKEVRIMAKKWQLSVAEKEASQDICFIGKDTMADFLKKHFHSNSGRIVDEVGKFLGKHSGLFQYTFGQRKGINVGGKGPYFVVGKKPKENLLIITNDKNSENLFTKKLSLEQVNWFEKQKTGKRIWLRTRYRNPLVSAIITKGSVKGRKIELEFSQKQWAVTGGQSAVFYSPRGEILGGGIIIN